MANRTVATAAAWTRTAASRDASASDAALRPRRARPDPGVIVSCTGTANSSSTGASGRHAESSVLVPFAIARTHWETSSSRFARVAAT